MKTAKDVTTALGKAAAVYAVELPAPRVAAYLEILLPRATPDALCAAIVKASASNRFFPTPSEILDHAGGVATLRAAEAWAKLDRSDPLTSEVMRLLGGWARYGQTLETELRFLERRFCELYPHVEAKRALSDQVIGRGPQTPLLR